MSSEPANSARQWQLTGAERYRAGDVAGAVEALKEAARLEPSEPSFLRNLAELSRASGRAEEARGWLEKAAAATRPKPDDLNLLAAAWLDLGAPAEALDAAVRALHAGGGPESRRLFAQAVRGAPRPGVRALLARALREDWAPAQSLRSPAVAILREAWPRTAADLAHDDLLAELLVSAPIADPELERRLAGLRRALLFATGDLSALTPVRVRLATQCHLNEYAWNLDAAEAEVVDRLAKDVAGGRARADEILNLASYRSLGGVAGAESLPDRAWEPAIRALLDEQVVGARIETELARGIPAITAIRPGVSEAVQRQYEESPYPRWTKITPQQPISVERLLKATFPFARLDPVAAAPEVLVAGGGTGQHVLEVAMRYVGAKVLAVDLSRASLAYAARKIEVAGRTDIELAQADLLELGAQPRRFDLIECVGVLHHLADPSEGLRVLTGLLRPGGLMRLGLYSRRGRQPLAAARALAKDYPTTAVGVRALRAAILAAPPGDPVRGALGFGDFYATSTCRDLLMHVQEHQMDLTEISRLLEGAGLRLIGFSVSAAVGAAYQRRFPGDLARTDLDNWATFEADHPATFAGMYQFWVQKPA
jgi:SAM-dependent methyltransferase